MVRKLLLGADMTKILFAMIMAMSAGASTQLSIEQPSVPSENQCLEQEPQEMSCKASGQKCEEAEDCCSRMCRKDNGRCG